MNCKGFFGKVRNVDSRIRSLFIVHISMLIFSMGNSIIVTGIWPYLQAVIILIHNLSYVFNDLIFWKGQTYFQYFAYFTVGQNSNLRWVRDCCCIRRLSSNHRSPYTRVRSRSHGKYSARINALFSDILLGKFVLFVHIISTRHYW